MSVFNIKSIAITNRDATSLKVLNDTVYGKGQVSESFGVVQTTAPIIDVASTLKLCVVPSRARLASMEYWAQGLGTSAIDIAVWFPTTIQTGGGNFLASSKAGALISSSTFDANIAGVDTGINGNDGFKNLTTVTIPARTQPLWQLLGLTADPEMDLDVGFSVRTATSVQGYVGLRCRFIE